MQNVNAYRLCTVFALWTLLASVAVSAEKPAPLDFRQTLQKFAFGDHDNRPSNADLFRVAETQIQNGWHKDALRTILLIKPETEHEYNFHENSQPPQDRLAVENIRRDFALGSLVEPLLNASESGEAVRAATAIGNERHRAFYLTKIVTAQSYASRSFDGKSSYRPEMIDRAMKTLELIPVEERDNAYAALAVQYLPVDPGKAMDMAEQIASRDHRARTLLGLASHWKFVSMPFSPEKQAAMRRMVDATDTPTYRLQILNQIIAHKIRQSTPHPGEDEFYTALRREAVDLILTAKNLTGHEFAYYLFNLMRDCQKAQMTEEAEKLLGLARELVDREQGPSSRISVLQSLRHFRLSDPTLEKEERDAMENRIFEEIARISPPREQVEQWIRISFDDTYSEERRQTARDHLIRELENLPKSNRGYFLLRMAQNENTEKLKRKEYIDRIFELQIETDSGADAGGLFDLLLKNGFDDEALQWATSDKWRPGFRSNIAQAYCQALFSRSNAGTTEFVKRFQEALSRIENPEAKVGFFLRLVDRHVKLENAESLDWSEIFRSAQTITDPHTKTRQTTRLKAMAKRYGIEIDESDP